MGARSVSAARRWRRQRLRAPGRSRRRARCCLWWAASAGVRGCLPMCWRNSNEVGPVWGRGVREAGAAAHLGPRAGWGCGRAAGREGVGGGGIQGPGGSVLFIVRRTAQAEALGAHGGGGARAWVGLPLPDPGAAQGRDMGPGFGTCRIGQHGRRLRFPPNGPAGGRVGRLESPGFSSLDVLEEGVGVGRLVLEPRGAFSVAPQGPC